MILFVNLDIPYTTSVLVAHITWERYGNNKKAVCKYDITEGSYV